MQNINYLDVTPLPPSVMEFLLIIIALIIVVIVTLSLFRYATRSSSTKELVHEGVRLTDVGIEIPRLFWMGKSTIDYNAVEFVELLPWYKAVPSVALLRYGIAVRSISTRLFHDTIVLKLNGPKTSEYVLITPGDAPHFAEELKQRIREREASPEKSSGNRGEI